MKSKTLDRCLWWFIQLLTKVHHGVINIFSTNTAVVIYCSTTVLHFLFAVLSYAL